MNNNQEQAIRLDERTQLAFIIANIVCAMPTKLLRDYLLEGLVNEYRQARFKFVEMPEQKIRNKEK